MKFRKIKVTLVSRCLDNDVDEISLAAVGEGNNLDRDTASSGDQASGKPNIDIGDIGDKRYVLWKIASFNVDIGGNFHESPQHS